MEEQQPEPEMDDEQPLLLMVVQKVFPPHQIFNIFCENPQITSSKWAKKLVKIRKILRFSTIFVLLVRNTS